LVTGDTEYNQILHPIPLLRVIELSGRGDVVDIEDTTMFSDVFGFSTSAMLAPRLISYANSLLLSVIPPCPIRELPAFPEWVVLTAPVLRAPCAATTL
jgi:hypothetical protein